MNIFELGLVFCLFFFATLYVYQVTRPLLHPKATKRAWFYPDSQEYIQNKRMRIIIYLTFLLLIPGLIIYLLRNLVWYETYMILLFYLIVILAVHIVYQNRISESYLEIYRSIIQSLDIFIEQLRVGKTIENCFAKTAVQIEGPLNPYFQTISQQLELGNSLEQSLMLARQTVPRLKYMEYFNLLLVIHAQTRNSLIDDLILLKQQLTVREEQERNLNLSVSTNRLAAIMTAVLPFVAMAMFYLMKPDFILPFLQNPLSPFIMFFATCILFTGVLLIFKITRPMFTRFDGEYV
ncbi:MAG: hypothetical protein WC627_00160 [Legionella sp.]|jgi:Flp pilus assembly protein TadB